MEPKPFENELCDGFTQEGAGFGFGPLLQQIASHLSSEPGATWDELTSFAFYNGFDDGANHDYKMADLQARFDTDPTLDPIECLKSCMQRSGWQYAPADQALYGSLEDQSLYTSYEQVLHYINISYYDEIDGKHWWKGTLGAGGKARYFQSDEHPTGSESEGWSDWDPRAIRQKASATRPPVPVKKIRRLGEGGDWWIGETADGELRYLYFKRKGRPTGYESSGWQVQEPKIRNAREKELATKQPDRKKKVSPQGQPAKKSPRGAPIRTDAVRNRGGARGVIEGPTWDETFKTENIQGLWWRTLKGSDGVPKKQYAVGEPGPEHAPPAFTEQEIQAGKAAFEAYIATRPAGYIRQQKSPEEQSQLRAMQHLTPEDDLRSGFLYLAAGSASDRAVDYSYVFNPKDKRVECQLVAGGPGGKRVDQDKEMGWVLDANKDFFVFDCNLNTTFEYDPKYFDKTSIPEELWNAFGATPFPEIVKLVEDFQQQREGLGLGRVPIALRHSSHTSGQKVIGAGTCKFGHLPPVAAKDAEGQALMYEADHFPSTHDEAEDLLMTAGEIQELEAMGGAAGRNWKPLMMQVDVISEISNDSGHYRPLVSDLNDAADVLEKRGIIKGGTLLRYVKATRADADQGGAPEDVKVTHGTLKKAPDPFRAARKAEVIRDAANRAATGPSAIAALIEECRNLLMRVGQLQDAEDRSHMRALRGKFVKFYNEARNGFADAIYMRKIAPAVACEKIFLNIGVQDSGSNLQQAFNSLFEGVPLEARESLVNVGAFLAGKLYEGNEAALLPAPIQRPDLDMTSDVHERFQYETAWGAPLSPRPHQSRALLDSASSSDASPIESEVSSTESDDFSTDSDSSRDGSRQGSRKPTPGTSRDSSPSRNPTDENEPTASPDYL